MSTCSLGTPAQAAAKAALEHIIQAAMAAIDVPVAATTATVANKAAAKAAAAATQEARRAAARAADRYAPATEGLLPENIQAHFLERASVLKHPLYGVTQAGGALPADGLPHPTEPKPQADLFADAASSA